MPVNPLSLADIAKRGGRQMAAALGGLTAASQSEDANAMFIGKLAKSVSEESLTFAKSLLDQGLGHKEVWEKLGVFEGLDGKMRKEIADNMATLNRNNALDLKKHPSQPGSRNSLYLDEMLDHPELFEEYPHLRQTLVKRLDDKSGSRGEYDLKSGNIGLRLNRSGDDVLSTLLHEIQHDIQVKEGWSQGSNMDRFTNHASKRVVEKIKQLGNEAQTQKMLLDSAERIAKRTSPDNKNYQRFQDEALAARKRWEATRDEVQNLGAQAHTLTPFGQYVRKHGEYEARLAQARAKADEYDQYPLYTPEPQQNVPLEQLNMSDVNSPAYHSKKYNYLDDPHYVPKAKGFADAGDPSNYKYNYGAGGPGTEFFGKAVDKLMNGPVQGIAGIAGLLSSGQAESRRLLEQDPWDTGTEVGEA